MPEIQREPVPLRAPTPGWSPPSTEVLGRRRFATLTDLPEAARIATEAGLDLVMDAWFKVEHARLYAGSPA